MNHSGRHPTSSCNFQAKTSKAILAPIKEDRYLRIRCRAVKVQRVSKVTAIGTAVDNGLLFVQVEGTQRPRQQQKQREDSAVACRAAPAPSGRSRQRWPPTPPPPHPPGSSSLASFLSPTLSPESEVASQDWKPPPLQASQGYLWPQPPSHSLALRARRPPGKNLAREAQSHSLPKVRASRASLKESGRLLCRPLVLFLRAKFWNGARTWGVGPL